MCMGHIYQIRNIITDAVYLGSVLKRNPQDRWVRHRKDLRGNHHHSQHLQRAWNKYGEGNFVFEVIESNVKDVLSREQWHLDNRRNNFPLHLTYNVCWKAGSCEGRKWSKVMLKKLSDAHKGIKPTAEAVAKQIATWESKCKHPYSFTSPNGVVYDDVRNLRRFAREHNLDARSLALVYNGTLRYFKGWTRTGISMPSYQLVSPDGVITQGTFLKGLCRNASINYKMVHKYCLGQSKPYRGWMAKQLT